MLLDTDVEAIPSHHVEALRWLLGEKVPGLSRQASAFQEVIGTSFVDWDSSAECPLRLKAPIRPSADGFRLFP